MCGIAGVWQPGVPGTPVVNILRLEEGVPLLNVMRRRGPDGQRFDKHIDANLYHTRLKIIDLSEEGGKQPAYWKHFGFVFNGELYNYKEQRGMLQLQGEEFVSQSDTEVLLRVLAQKGIAGLQQCEGMWAFALVDFKDFSLTLCRDRFGEKPLYYYIDEVKKLVFFGSEPKYIFHLLGKQLPVNQERVLSFLVNGYRSLYKSGECTFFQGLREVPAGQAVIFRRGCKAQGVAYDQDWMLLRREQPMTYQEAVQGVQDRLIRAVELRLRADVPLAFCLSGGVDSNGITAIAKKVCGYDVQGFTVGYEDARYAEKPWVEAAREAYGIPVTWIQPNEKVTFFPALREMIRHRDGPVSTASYFAHFWLMRTMFQQHYKVSLSGTGADELFSGYYDHHLWYLAQMARSGHTKEYLYGERAWRQKILPQVRNSDLRRVDQFLINPSRREYLYDGRAEILSFLRNEPEVAEFTEDFFTFDLLRNRMLNELFSEVVPVILHEDDANAMFWSIENRSPYLDRELTRFAQTIPTRYLIRQGLAKAVLRDALRPWVPEVILDNPRKVGFNAPIEALVHLEQAHVRQEILADSSVYALVDRQKMVALLEQETFTNTHSKFLFNFLNIKVFLEMYSEGREFCDSVL